MSLDTDTSVPIFVTMLLTLILGTNSGFHFSAKIDGCVLGFMVSSCRTSIFYGILHQLVANKARWMYNRNSCFVFDGLMLQQGFLYMLSSAHIDGLVQERHNSIANALELRLSFTDPLIYLYQETSLYPSVSGSLPIQGSDGPDNKVHGANMGPVGPRWAPCWPHEPRYQGLSLSLQLLYNPSACMPLS